MTYLEDDTMIKTTLYPKTKRVGAMNTNVIITEKIDGSNLSFFKHQEELWIAQRNWIFQLDEVLETTTPVGLYKGLRGFLELHGEDLKEDLQPNACIIGEWIGTGKLSYAGRLGRFVQFAKSNVIVDTENPGGNLVSLKNLYYDHDLFKWSYVNQAQPSYIRSVPIVEELSNVPTKQLLDAIYEEYTAYVDRSVEGFIVNMNNNITKYVRMKNGTLTDHRS